MFNLFLSFLKIGFLAFGGGYGALSLIQDEIVQLNHWIDAETFLNLIAIAQITPGPIAINSATFVGYELYGILGSTVATLGVIIPSVFWLFLLEMIIKLLSKKIDVQKIFFILRLSTFSLIIAATLRIGISSIFSLFTIFLFLTAFLLLKIFKPSVIWIVLGCGGAGVIYSLFA